LAPGELRLADGVLYAGATGGTALALNEVQMEGKSRMSGAAFGRDFQLRAGERLG
jgi:methionyl-tRNA formyltransferase